MRAFFLAASAVGSARIALEANMVRGMGWNGAFIIAGSDRAAFRAALFCIRLFRARSNLKGGLKGGLKVETIL